MLEAMSEPCDQKTHEELRPEADSSDGGVSSTESSRCSICLAEFTDDDPPASEADSTSHGIVFSCPHAPMLHLSCLMQEARQNRPFHCPLCRAKFGFAKTCICGWRMQRLRGRRKIPGYGDASVRCDHCFRKIPWNEGVYHCPNGKVSVHPSGYDVCCTCAGEEPPPDPERSRSPERYDHLNSERERLGRLDPASPRSRSMRRRNVLAEAPRSEHHARRRARSEMITSSHQESSQLRTRRRLQVSTAEHGGVGGGAE